MIPLREETLEQLEKVLNSRSLQGSESLRAFLRFVVVRTIDNQHASLKEYTIATEVFGRANSYDSRSDSAVRVQAGRLRSKLEEYYATEGRQDKVLIDLPKGHYTPTFSYVDDNNGLNAPSEPNQISSLLVRKSRITRNWPIVLSAALIILVVLLVALALRYRSQMTMLQRSQAGVPNDEVQSAEPIWGSFFNSPEPVLVTFSNALFSGTAETGMKLLKPLDSPDVSPPPVSQTPSVRGVHDEGKSVITDHYTGIGEVIGIYALGELFGKADRSVRVKRSLMVTWDDVKTENIVILGSPAENFVLRDLPQQQDFVFRLLKDEKQNTTLAILNTKPKSGEQTTYFARQDGPSRSRISEDYALISLLRGLDEKHRLMMLAGITTYGTQAAAEYLTNPEYIKDLISHLNTSSPGEAPRLPSFYQVLVKVKVNGGVPVMISYVTHHVL